MSKRKNSRRKKPAAKPIVTDRLERAAAIFRAQGGTMGRKDAVRARIHPRTLYELRDAGVIVPLARGLFRLAEAQPLGNPDLVTVALKVPKGVICLISALAYYELTTKIPHEVYLAIPRGAERPRLAYPPLRSFWFSGERYSEGVQTHLMDDVPVRIYCREKSLADCFKYRNVIGLDTALEALRFYKQERRIDIEALMRYAAICRVTKVIRPYLEATL